MCDVRVCLGTCEVLQYIRYHAGIKEEALGELKSHVLSFSTSDSPDTFVDLKVVVGRQSLQEGGEGLVVI